MSYETRDASVFVIGIGTGLLALMVALSIATSAWYYAKRIRNAPVPTVPRTSSFVGGPHEQIGILVDYAKVVQSSDEHLHGYSWVDQKSGIARIPIDRAIELTATGVKPAPAPKPPGQVP